MSVARAIAHEMPIRIPTTTTRTPSRAIILTIPWRVAPSAIHTPISLHTHRHRVGEKTVNPQTRQQYGQESARA